MKKYLKILFAVAFVSHSELIDVFFFNQQCGLDDHIVASAVRIHGDGTLTLYFDDGDQWDIPMKDSKEVQIKDGDITTTFAAVNGVTVKKDKPDCHLK